MVIIIFFNSITISFSREVELWHSEMVTETLDTCSTLNNLLTNITYEFEMM
jgi:hypothetical protein